MSSFDAYFTCLISFRAKANACNLIKLKTLKKRKKTRLISTFKT